MKDSIVQEVRDARAAVSADSDFDLHKFFAWAKAHTAAESKAEQWLPASPEKRPETSGGKGKSATARKPRVRPERVSA